MFTLSSLTPVALSSSKIIFSLLLHFVYKNIKQRPFKKYILAYMSSANRNIWKKTKKTQKTENKLPPKLSRILAY